ncbi:protein lin-37 homolog isoform X3 [Enhydra lutris kenyoni]|uniref:Protein lin-37 homolog isoform X3 n=1 Tax=Enhydra lutris kenyoni TaxID=391180 RepID=A0A2Y9L6E7_ENHLU|nr:protein lin-37 homolog isoform X3 [Enhydra lutris kenyoni]
MFPVKVKVEKSELEMAKARNQLDAVLQCLLEKSHMDRERLEEEAGKTPSDTHNKDCSIAATGKRPSARFPHQRRKKRREMDDGLAEGGPQRSNTYVIKLFDRSVDLAQFSENTPLYPICRAWMRNSPSVRERERSPSSPLRPLPEDEEVGHAAGPFRAASGEMVKGVLPQSWWDRQAQVSVFAGSDAAHRCEPFGQECGWNSLKQTDTTTWPARGRGQGFLGQVDVTSKIRGSQKLGGLTGVLTATRCSHLPRGADEGYWAG